MRKIILLVFSLLILESTYAQNYILTQEFNDTIFPPSGWSITSHSANWTRSYTNIALGNMVGEAQLDGEPSFFGATRLVSPSIDLSNLSNVSLSFKHNLAFSTSLQGNGVIGVATRSYNAAWHSVWEEQLTTDIPATTITIPINNSDTNSTNFQFCFYFDGISYIVADWNIDDVNLYYSITHDVKVSSIKGTNTFDMNDNYQTKAVIENVGLNTESFDVECKIYIITIMSCLVM